MHVLKLHCDDTPGIVAAVATTLSNNQCNIEESSQFNDPFSGQFFMRVVFNTLEKDCLVPFTNQFKDIAKKFKMYFQICDLDIPIKTIILVSNHDHCLHDLLYRWQKKSLPLDIKGVVSNHTHTEKLTLDHGLPFYFLPVATNKKEKQEQEMGKIIDTADADLIILARYMQILSDDFCTKYLGKVINIHHSFLPGFKGARPYTQAYERGVKIIGSTAHFATADLDEGPIIVQGTVSINHSYTPKEMERLGQNSEAIVLADAVKLFCEHRIFMHKNRTIIL